MAFFDRLRVLKDGGGNPYHDAQGKFTSGGSAVFKDMSNSPAGNHYPQTAAKNALAAFKNHDQLTNALKENPEKVHGIIQSVIEQHPGWGSGLKGWEMLKQVSEDPELGHNLTESLKNGASYTKPILAGLEAAETEKAHEKTMGGYKADAIKAALANNKLYTADPKTANKAINEAVTTKGLLNGEIASKIIDKMNGVAMPGTGTHKEITDALESVKEPKAPIDPDEEKALQAELNAPTKPTEGLGDKPAAANASINESQAPKINPYSIMEEAGKAAGMGPIMSKDNVKLSSLVEAMAKTPGITAETAAYGVVKGMGYTPMPGSGSHAAFTEAFKNAGLPSNDGGAHPTPTDIQTSPATAAAVSNPEAPKALYGEGEHMHPLLDNVWAKVKGAQVFNTDQDADKAIAAAKALSAGMAAGLPPAKIADNVMLAKYPDGSANKTGGSYLQILGALNNSGYQETKTQFTPEAKPANTGTDAHPAVLSPLGYTVDQHEGETPPAPGSKQAQIDHMMGLFQKNSYNYQNDAAVKAKFDAAIAKVAAGKQKSAESKATSLMHELGYKLKDYTNQQTAKKIAQALVNAGMPSSTGKFTPEASLESAVAAPKITVAPPKVTASGDAHQFEDAVVKAVKYHPQASEALNDTIKNALYGMPITNSTVMAQDINKAMESGNKQVKEAHAANTQSQAYNIQKIKGALMAAGVEAGPDLPPAPKPGSTVAPTPAPSYKPPAPPSNGAIGNTSTEGFKNYINQHDDLGKLMNQRPLLPGEKTALEHYKGSGYDALNGQLRSGKTLSSQVFKEVAALDTATHSGTIPAGTLIYRGISDYDKPFGGLSELQNVIKTGGGHLDNGFISCSSDKNFSDSWGGGGSKSVLFELKLNRDTPAVHVAIGKYGKANNNDVEYEVVLPRGQLWKVQGMRYEKTQSSNKKLIVTMEQA